MIILTPLQYEDCEAVAFISETCLLEHWSLESIRKTLDYAENLYYVARDEASGTIVGFAGIMVIDEDAELLNIAVLPEYRSLGVGSTLLKQVMYSAKKKNARRMLLEVREHNEAAQHLYKKNNFCVLGMRRGYYKNPVEDAIIMECRLETIILH